MMKANRLVCTSIVFLLAGAFAFAQTSTTGSSASSSSATGSSTVQSAGPNPISVGQPVASKIGINTAQQALKEISVSQFEDPGLWQGSMPLDEGIIALRGLPGHPPNAKPVPGAQQAGINIPDNTVLGVKVIFFKRGYDQFSVLPLHPIPVEGIVKTLSVWVVGRNTNHVLSVLVRGIDGEVAKLPLGKLNFVGWKKLTVAIPPSVVQTNYHYSNHSGIEIEGFVIDTAPLEAYGTFYMYFDDLTAVTDLFNQQQRSKSDIPGNW